MPHKWDSEGYEKNPSAQKEGFRTGGYPLFSSCPGGKNKSPLSCPQNGLLSLS
jgi:hypothetical protein